ncbi:MAG: rhombosortase [Planctomycetes bacterium]|nr:rhombosortase [Planctomycetota bacterium]
MIRRGGLTLTLLAIATAALVSPRLAEGLQLDRGAVASGEAWRLLTGHLTHWSPEHFLWDAGAFAVLGLLCERRGRRRYAACLGLSAAAIGLGFLLACPELPAYRGLSGVDSALFALAAADLLGDARREGRRILAAAAAACLVALALKLAGELATGATPFVDAEASGFVPVPLAHALGAASGGAVALLSASRRLECRETMNAWRSGTKPSSRPGTGRRDPLSPRAAGVRPPRPVRPFAVATAMAACLGAACVAEIPDSWRPRVVLGSGSLTKRLACDCRSLGGVTDIAHVRPRRRADQVVVAAGTAGALFLEPETCRVLETVKVNDGRPPFHTYRIVDADGDGDIELLRFPGAGEDTAALYSDLGQKLWTASCPSRSFPLLAFGDLEGDGRLEFLLSGLHSDKVRLVDHAGRRLWDERWDRGTNDVAIADLDLDGRAEIVCTNGKQLVIRDRHRKVVHREPFPEGCYVNDLHVLEGPRPDGPLRLCVGFYDHGSHGREVGQRYRILEADGSTVAKEIGPQEMIGPYLPRRAVRLEAGAEPYAVRIAEAKYQGVLVGFSATRLVVKVFDGAGTPVYEELVASSAGEVARGDGAMVVVPSATPGEERLLVGYGPDLWEYQLVRP